MQLRLDGTAASEVCSASRPSESSVVGKDFIIVGLAAYKNGWWAPCSLASKVCLGHCTCDDKGACVCQDNWFGERCQYMCPWDSYKRHSSGNGTCAYNPEIQTQPYCVCDRWNTADKDPEVAAANRFKK